MIVSVPVCTCGTLPDTGASSIAAPRSFTRCARSRLTCGLTVLMSTQTFPAARPARIPSGPDATSLEDAVVRNRREDDVGGPRDLPRRIAPDQSLAFQVLHF